MFGMFHKIKIFTKKNISPRQWEKIKNLLIPCLKNLKIFTNFIIYIILWLLPLGFIGSFGRRKKIVLFYDLRVSTYRFDAVTGLLAALTNVRAGKGEKFDLVIYDPVKGRREDGPLKCDASEGMRLHYLISVIFESLNVVGSVDEIHYVRSPIPLYSIWMTTKFSHLLPSFYTPFLPETGYSLKNPLKIIKNKKEALPRLLTSPIFDEKVDQLLESVGVTGSFLTLNIRQKTWEKSYWNWSTEERSAMLDLATKLREGGLIEHILVLKDFDNPFATDSDHDLISQGFIVVPEATLSVRFRVSLCSKATVNLCGTNGTSLFALFNSPPCLFLNKDNWDADDGAEGDFFALYDNIHVVKGLESFRSGLVLNKISTMISEGASLSNDL